MARVAVILGLASAIAIAAWLYTPDADRGALVATYAAPPSTFLTVAGIRLHIRDTGPRDASALILLHGFGSSLHTWDAWAGALSARYRVIRFDLPGFGLTGPDPTGDYSDTRAIDIIIALMDELHLDRATFIGNSLGGKLAWQFAAAHPDRTARLVLISPDGFASPGFAYNVKPEVPALVRLLPYLMPKFFLRSTLLPAYVNQAALTAQVMDRYYDMMRAPGVRRAIIARMQQVRLQPPEPFLRRIKASTLLLWGEGDAMIPYGNAQDYLRAISNCRLVSFPNLGHVPQEEDPTKSLVPINDFLQTP